MAIGSYDDLFKKAKETPKAETPKKEPKEILKAEPPKKEPAKEPNKEPVKPLITPSTLIDKVSKKLSSKELDAEEFRYYARQEIVKEIESLKGQLPDDVLEKIKVKALEQSGYGVIEKYLSDDTITEIIVQKYDDILIERGGIVEAVPDKFSSNEELENVINKIVGQRGKAINYSHPIVDTALFDGSRVAAQIPPIAIDGATMTIRKFSKEKLTMDDLIKFGSVTEEAAEFLKELVRKKKSLIISGGTGTGKTTVLNILSGYIPKNELIVTIEDTPELMLQSPRVRRLVTRESINKEKDNIDIRALVKASLRMRPDRIIIGEVRGKEYIDYISAQSTGHEGGMLSLHADSPKNAINSRIPTLVDGEISNSVIKLQFVEAVDYIIQLKRYPNGQRKIVEIAKIEGIEKGEVIIKSIFKGSYDDPEVELKKEGG